MNKLLLLALFLLVATTGMAQNKSLGVNMFLGEFRYSYRYMDIRNFFDGKG